MWCSRLAILRSPVANPSSTSRGATRLARLSVSPYPLRVDSRSSVSRCALVSLIVKLLSCGKDGLPATFGTSANLRVSAERVPPREHGGGSWFAAPIGAAARRHGAAAHRHLIRLRDELAHWMLTGSRVAPSRTGHRATGACPTNEASSGPTSIPTPLLDRSPGTWASRPETPGTAAQ